ncbi:MAG: hypothetical protein M1828_005391 [Chrysothrix sp. TS-e1954]|nr:MAG: hypothetical protein M1828_005391 [Chrysothrix sp. TS-e1954]
MASSATSASSTLKPSSTSTGPPAATTTGDDGSDSPTSKPLLFFVALGVGIVFVNLWIIIGVKYCFRYNQRARAGLLNAQTGEPIGMGDMPRNRRRREKKLMSMDEVNERFPLTKYKMWRASREQEGLPAAGGVTATHSRAASIKEHNLERISTENDESLQGIDMKESAELHERPKEVAQTDAKTQNKDFADAATARQSHEVEGAGASAQQEPSKTVIDTGVPNEGEAANASNSTPVTVDEKVAGDDEEDPISAAVPTDLLNHPGDACAICIETLEDDDEVRGLTCGHAFHAGCVDPWLTSRRACCPLCKTDYYVPKPRPEGEVGADRQVDPSGVSQPEAAHVPGGQARSGGTRLVVAGSAFTVTHHDRFGFPILTLDRPRRPTQRRGRSQSQMRRVARGEASPSTDEPTPQAQPNRATTWIRSLPNNLRRPRMPVFGSRRNETEQTPQQPTTPSQLEAGAR